MRSDLVRQHFINPRNVGEIGSADALGRAGSLTCGAAVLISLRLGESQRITQAKFKAAGCSYLVAASSLLTEQIKGNTTAEAATLGHSPEKLISAMLTDWPPEREHCAALACEALIAAIRTYSDSVRHEWEGDDALICTCFCVSERTIENEIQRGELRSITDVTNACYAGAGCRSCCRLIQDMLDVYWLEQRIRNRELCI